MGKLTATLKLLRSALRQTDAGPNVFQILQTCRISRERVICKRVWNVLSSVGWFLKIC